MDGPEVHNKFMNSVYSNRLYIVMLFILFSQAVYSQEKIELKNSETLLEIEGGNIFPPSYPAGINCSFKLICYVLSKVLQS